MSGVLGLLNLDGAPVDPAELRAMASMLRYRGPDREGVWHEGSLGLGQTLLATTPESLVEHAPLWHAASGCVVTGDVRLDNRRELIGQLPPSSTAGEHPGDLGIVLAAYLEWGRRCLERIRGDFALAIWDPSEQTLFCARDQMGMRQLVFHHVPRQLFAFATEPRAILALERVPYRIDEARIADFLLDTLEGVDKTSTFFEGVVKLPPAHALAVTSEGISQWRYWRPERGDELRLGSDREYAEAFLGVFEEAVRARLRTARRPAAMLSGGIDSGTIVSVATRVLAEDSRGPLLTFSAVSPVGEADPETRAIEAAAVIDGLDPQRVPLDGFAGLPELLELTAASEEPFDCHMTLPRVIYLAARRRGVNAVLDGASGDVVLSPGRHLARLMRRGALLTAIREARAESSFWGGGLPPTRELLRATRAAFVPAPLLERLGSRRRVSSHERLVREAHVDPGFAARVDVLSRLAVLDRHRTRFSRDRWEERSGNLEHPYLVVGRERYDRVAAAAGVEARDPFLDLRVVELSLRLPDEQLIRGGWPKLVLRNATEGLLPEAVRWRRGKEHLGRAFNDALVAAIRPTLRRVVPGRRELLLPYLGEGPVRALVQSVERGDAHGLELAYNAFCLTEWLQRHARRPVAEPAFRGGGEE